MDDQCHFCDLPFIRYMGIGSRKAVCWGSEVAVLWVGLWTGWLIRGRKNQCTGGLIVAIILRYTNNKCGWIMAKQLEDKLTAELPGLSDFPKKRGRPSSGKAAKTVSQRQRALRERDAKTLIETGPSEWNVRQCLMALSKTEWRGEAMGKEAWVRIGVLMGYSTPHGNDGQ